MQIGQIVQKCRIGCAVHWIALDGPVIGVDTPMPIQPLLAQLSYCCDVAVVLNHVD